MTTYIALLRAVNLGGSTTVSMARLRALLARRGFHGARTLLRSGNVVFQADEQTPDQLERALEAEVSRALGLNTDFFVRNALEWRTVVQGNPFPKAADEDPAHLVVTWLKTVPAPKAWKALGEAIQGPESVRAFGRQAFILYPDGIGHSKVTPALIEQKLGTRGTSRNWNTVLKLDRMASG